MRRPGYSPGVESSLWAVAGCHDVSGLVTGVWMTGHQPGMSGAMEEGRTVTQPASDSLSLAGLTLWQPLRIYISPRMPFYYIFRLLDSIYKRPNIRHFESNIRYSDFTLISKNWHASVVSWRLVWPNRLERWLMTLSAQSAQVQIPVRTLPWGGKFHLPIGIEIWQRYTLMILDCMSPLSVYVPWLSVYVGSPGCPDLPFRRFADVGA